jgi:hypothetical protein
MGNQSKKGRPAFSVQQPFAEQILQGIKAFEYRTIRTHTRGRVYIYASRTIYRDAAEWQKLRLHPGQVPIGKVVGTVEIIDCDWSAELSCYRWHLARPQRIPARRPLTHPQPVWFYPFAGGSAYEAPDPDSDQGCLPFDPPTFR